MNIPLQGFVPLFVPGYGDSLAPHWQAAWFARLPGALWADLGDWEAPECGAWVARLQRAVARSDRPVLLVSHSLGGLAVAHWAARHGAGSAVAGAMLVVPPDPAAPVYPASIRGFSRPDAPLPFPSLLVASRNDPYAAFDWSRETAARLGSRFVDAGEKQHINPAAGFGPWPEGEALLAGFAAELAVAR